MITEQTPDPPDGLPAEPESADSPDREPADPPEGQPVAAGPQPVAAVGGPSTLDGWALAGGVPLLLAGVLHVVCMFFSQAAGVGPMDTSTSTVVTQAVLAAGWLVAAGLALPARTRPAGSALGAGLALAELGLVVSAVGGVGEMPGPGLLLLAAGWVLGAAGAVVAGLGSPVGPGRPYRRVGPGWLVLLTSAAAVLVGVALLPAWDHYRVMSRVLGRVVVVNESDTFTLPAPILAGTVAAAVAWAVVPIVASFWRPARLGVMAGAGVLVALASQVASAVVGLDPPGVLVGLFGSSRVSGFGLELLGASLRPWFDVETVAGLALALFLVARWWTPDPTDAPVPTHAPWVPAGPPAWSPGPTWGVTADAGSGWPVPPGWPPVTPAWADQWQPGDPGVWARPTEERERGPETVADPQPPDRAFPDRWPPASTPVEHSTWAPPREES